MRLILLTFFISIFFLKLLRCDTLWQNLATICLKIFVTKAKTDFLHSMPFHSGQAKPDFIHSSRAKLTLSIKIYCIPTRPKPTSSIPVRPKLTFYITIYSSQSKTDFLQSKLFQAGKTQLSQLQTVPVRPHQTFSILSHSNSSQANIVNKSSLLFLPCRSWSPNYSVLVLLLLLLLPASEFVVLKN
jgi:hypothetical protein